MSSVGYLRRSDVRCLREAVEDDIDAELEFGVIVVAGAEPTR